MTNLQKIWLEYDEKRKVGLLSAFELFEHFDKPMEEISHLLSLSDNILFSTLIYDRDLKYKNWMNGGIIHQRQESISAFTVKEH